MVQRGGMGQSRGHEEEGHMSKPMGNLEQRGREGVEEEK